MYKTHLRLPNRPSAASTGGLFLKKKEKCTCVHLESIQSMYFLPIVDTKITSCHLVVVATIIPTGGEES